MKAHAIRLASFVGGATLPHELSATTGPEQVILSISLQYTRPWTRIEYTLRDLLAQ